MSKKLWQPDPARVAASNLKKFFGVVESRWGVSCADYTSLHQWSVDAVDDLGAVHREVISLPRGAAFAVSRSFRFTCLTRHSYSILARTLHGDRVAVVSADVHVRSI